MGTLFQLENCDMPHDLDPDAEKPKRGPGCGPFIQIGLGAPVRVVRNEFWFQIIAHGESDSAPSRSTGPTQLHQATAARRLRARNADLFKRRAHVT